MSLFMYVFPSFFLSVCRFFVHFVMSLILPCASYLCSWLLMYSVLSLFSDSLCSLRLSFSQSFVISLCMYCVVFPHSFVLDVFPSSSCPLFRYRLREFRYWFLYVCMYFVSFICYFVSYFFMYVALSLFIRSACLYFVTPYVISLRRSFFM